MPYKTNRDLPGPVQEHLPKHAQDIYLEAFNHAYAEYQNPNKKRNPNESTEAVCHKVAWAAVKKKYIRTSTGNWQTKK